MISAYKKSQGNALFLILIAVALFAALSYAITQSGRGGGNVSREQALINSAQMIQYAGALEHAVQKLQLINNCDITDISFTNTIEAGYAHTPAAPTSCQIFHPDGGGLTYQDFDNQTGSNGFTAITNGNDLAGTTTSDLIFIVNDIPLDTCNQLNQSLEAPTLTNGNPLTETGSQRDLKYTGSFLAGWRYTVNPAQVMPDAFCIIQTCYAPSTCPNLPMNAFVYNLHTN